MDFHEQNIVETIICFHVFFYFFFSIISRTFSFSKYFVEIQYQFQSRVGEEWYFVSCENFFG